MTDNELKAEASFLASIGIVDSLVSKGIITAADRERARDALIEEYKPSTGVLVSDKACYLEPSE